jgi:hypothetical protein
MKKKLVFVAMLALSVAMFAGCQSDEQAENPPATATQAPEATKEPVQDNVGAIEAPEPTATPEPTPEPEVWGDNKFEAMIPEPPLKGWEVAQYPDEPANYYVKYHNVTVDENILMVEYIEGLDGNGFRVDYLNGTTIVAYSDVIPDGVRAEFGNGEILLIITNYH